MEVRKTAVAGTMESSDIMVTISPNAGGIEIELDSSVEKQFGKAIRKSITDTLSELDIRAAKVSAVDKGALDCAIRARVLASAYRACECDAYLWGGAQK